MRRIASISCVIALTCLFAVALWFRISSLEAIPGHNGDESYYGLQTARLLRGESFAFRTTSNNLLNPFLVVLQIPFHLLAKPSLWVLRIPAVLCGVLAVVLTYVLGSKALDRTTGLVAATLLAALPLAIFYSRVGHEYSQDPLFGILVIACALRANGVGLLVSFLASLLVHPISVFLVPIALPVYLVQLLRKEGDPVRRRRTLLVAAMAALAIIAANTILLLRNPFVQHCIRQRPALNWLKFLDGFERDLFFLYWPVSKSTLTLHRWVFRSLLIGLLPFGMRRLARERQWDRMTLIVGLFASLLGFHLVAGPTILKQFATHRYGVVFVVPTVLAFACLLRALAPTLARAEMASPLTHPAPLAVAFVLGWALLFSFKLNFFDAHTAGSRESIWTFQAESKETFQRVFSIIRRDIARRKAGRNTAEGVAKSSTKASLIVAQDYWASMPLAYLANSHKEIKVVQLIDWEDITSCRLSQKTSELRECLRAGAYAVGFVGVPAELGGNVFENAVQSFFPPKQIQQWEVLSPNGGRCLAVYRFKEVRAGSPVPVGTAQPKVAGRPPVVRR
jgi:hypothetical protein